MAVCYYYVYKLLNKNSHVKNIPTKKKKEKDDARLSDSLRNNVGEKDTHPKAPQKQGETLCLKVMLSKHKRIPRSVFGALRGHNMSLSTQHLSLRVFPMQNCENAAAQFAFVVSNKISKKAVMRNKIKRRGYEAIAKFLGKTKPCRAYVFYCKSNPPASYREMEQDVKELILKTA